MVDVNIAVNFIAVIDNKVLLIRRNSFDNIEPSKWAIPGGKCEENETIEEALKREIKEELGVNIKTYNYFKSYYYKNKSNKHTRALYFYGQITEEIYLNEESSEFKWFELEKITEKMAFNHNQVLIEFQQHLIKITNKEI
jgi:mutator protein MutT